MYFLFNCCYKSGIFMRNKKIIFFAKFPTVIRFYLIKMKIVNMKMSVFNNYLSGGALNDHDSQFANFRGRSKFFIRWVEADKLTWMFQVLILKTWNKKINFGSKVNRYKCHWQVASLNLCVISPKLGTKTSIKIQCKSPQKIALVSNKNKSLSFNSDRFRFMLHIR